MSKRTSILILSVAALCLSATPSLAQSYGSGSSASSIPQTQSRSAPRAPRTLNKAEKRRLKAQQQKEKFEAQLAKKENSEVSYGSGTTKSAPSYGSGTDAAPAVQSYSSKTLKTESVVKKVDHVKVDGDYVMREGDFIKDKAPASSSLPINCPAGSTAQSNGTCLLTSGSFPSE